MLLASRRGRDAAGVTQREVAKLVGTTNAHIGRCEQEHEPDAPSLLKVADPAAPLEWALSLLRFAAAQHGHTVQPAPEVQHGDDHAARMCAVTVECTELARALARVLTQRGATDADLLLIEKHARAAGAAARETEAWASAELRARRK